MKGIKAVFMLTITMLVLAPSFISADEQLAIPVEKTVSPGCKIIVFDEVTYRVFTGGNYYLRFEKVDEAHHRVQIIPAEGELAPYCAVYMQWDFFPPVCLNLGLGGGTTYLLGTETGYAEK